jgi:hypothetical protein
MEVTNEKTTGFYIHTLAIGADATLRLLTPEWIAVPGEPPKTADATPTPHKNHAKSPRSLANRA